MDTQTEQDELNTYTTVDEFSRLLSFDVLKKYNYEKLMLKKPEHVARISMFLDFYEHPTQGDDSSLIVVDKDKKIAFLSCFYDVPNITDIQVFSETSN